MKYGYVYPGGEARTAAECAGEAEAAGWDGFFVWEPVWGVDTWVTLAAAAMCTERIRLGTMLTPLSRRRPWKLASDTATVDRLSNGRLILSVGLGAVDTGFTQFGEVTDRSQRAELLDEGLDIMTGLWRGQPFAHDGKHYHVTETTFFPPPPPVQSPRIPIWVVGAWPHRKSMARALRYDGLLAAVQNAEGKFDTLTPDHLREIMPYVAAHRTAQTPFDIVVEGKAPLDDPQKAASLVRSYADAGATWWIEAQWELGESMWAAKTQGAIRERIRRGPPRIQKVQMP
jgi:alkanesulfonate monooxygenase SsuD/methylene tetrahydromethanopterin reductase-like flavin-dependent oxidoreductase (luciferase family)